MTVSESSKISVWIAATRPRTLAAAVVPVALGTAVAFAEGKASMLPAFVALFCALLIQIGTNFINEIYDFRRGADTAERLGPTRAVAAGLLTEREMTTGAALVLGTAFVAGLYLVYVGGWVILAIGLASIFFAWAYTGGAYPLAYNGLGDVFVFIFFGIVAVMGTTYAQTLEFSLASFIVSLAPGALATNILGVNNLRDISTDRVAGKRTLAVRFGRSFARRLYLTLTCIAFLAPVLLFGLGYQWSVLLPLVATPLAVRLCRQILSTEGRALNPYLGETAKLLVIHGLLFTLGIITTRFF